MKAKRIFFTVAAIGLLITVFASCIFDFNKSKTETDKDGVPAIFNTKTDKQLREDALSFLKDNFPTDTFSDEQILVNAKEQKIFSYYSANLKQRVSVRNNWQYNEVYELLHSGEERPLRIYFWHVETNYFAYYWRPFEETYTSITAEWFDQSKLFFDYSKCFHSILDNYVPGKIKEYMRTELADYNNFWFDAEVLIPVKCNSENLNRRTEAFMRYLYEMYDNQSYYPSDYSARLSGKLFYLKDETEISNVTENNLQNQDWVKENCSKIITFTGAGKNYEEN